MMSDFQEKQNLGRKQFCDVEGKELDLCHSFLFHLNVLGPTIVAHIFQGNIADTSRWNTPHL